MKHYPKLSGWVQPVRRGFRMSCCDCHLVHTVDFRIVKGRVQIKIERNNRATFALRRHRPIVARTSIAKQLNAMRKRHK